MTSSRQRGLAAPFALVTGFGALFALGTVAAGLHGRFSPTAMLIAVAAVVTALSFVAEPLAAIPLGFVGWLTAPFAGRSAVVLAACALAAGGLGLLLRRSADRPILEGVGSDTGQLGAGAVPGRSRAGRGAGGGPALERDSVLAKAAYAVGARRALTGVLVAAVGLPLLTLLLALARHHLSLTDDLLIYLVAVVALAVIGGFWPAVLGAASASLLLTLAQTVLGGADTPAAVLDHLVATLGGQAELLESVSGRWVKIAASGSVPDGAATTRLNVRTDLALEVAGQPAPIAPGLLAGFAAQAAAALDRERLRTQAAQAEALAEGNRMRTALLAAV